MNRREAKRIYRSTCKDLREANIRFETVGTGNYMYVAYAFDFRYAVIIRTSFLEVLIEMYTETLMSSSFHHRINLQYLHEANLLLDHEPIPEKKCDIYRVSYASNLAPRMKDAA